MVLLILVIFSFFLGVLSLMGGRSVAWGMFAFMGALIAAYCALALASDGELTSGSTLLASAGTLDWNGLVLLPLSMAGADLSLAIMAVLRKLGVNI